MELSEEQKSSVTAWIQEGRSLAEVQRMLLEDHKISMTYMDVRFLVDDLDIEVVEPVTDEDESAAEEAKPAADAELVDEGGDGSVFVDVDAVMRPGSLVSGTVKFSDGQSLGWQLSASGQLGLIPDEANPEYRPKPEDLEQFQTQLQEVLQQKGF
ncbi:MAG: hypothetical protein ACPGSB_11260 [Opitutales bacterium]